MTTEFSVEVPNVGKVDVDRQNDGQDDFWDLFDSDGFCLNEGNAFYTLPTKQEVIDFVTANQQ